jgi:hypothetical protein
MITDHFKDLFPLFARVFTVRWTRRGTVKLVHTIRAPSGDMVPEFHMRLLSDTAHVNINQGSSWLFGDLFCAPSRFGHHFTIPYMPLPVWSLDLGSPPG